MSSEINKILTSELNFAAKRPSYSVLDNSRYYSDFDFQKTSLNSDISEVLHNIRIQSKLYN